MAAVAEIEIIVGTYEELLIGYRVKNKDDSYFLEQSFTNHSHCGSVRSVASRDRYLASGSSDETIKLFNMKTRCEIGGIVQHEGTVNCLQFFDNHHLFSASEDGSICIWKTGGWNCLKTLIGHKGGVNSLSIHPSGKLALSVSKDKSLKTWNLVKGRAAYTTNIKAVGDCVQWSPKGSLYAVVIGSIVNVYNLQTAAVVHTIDFGHRINAVEFVTENILAIGGEGENIEFHAADKKAILCVLQTHTKRIKALDCITALDDSEQRWLVSSSSDGFIKIWKFAVANLSKRAPKLVAQVATGCRITCQTVIGNTPTTKKESLEDDAKGCHSDEIDDKEADETDDIDSETSDNKRKPTSELNVTEKKKAKKR